MTESILKSIMRLFAIIGNLRNAGDNVMEQNAYTRTREIAEAYLNQLINPDQSSKYMQIFEFHYKNLQRKRINRTHRKVAVYSVKMLLICEQINSRLDDKQKAFILLQLFDILYDEVFFITDEAAEFVQTIADCFGFSINECQALKAFIFDSRDAKASNNNFLLISGTQKPADFSHHITRENLSGWLTVYYCPFTQTYYFRHEGSDDELQFNGRDVYFHRIYLFEKGSAIRCPKIQTIHYSDIAAKFLKLNFQQEILLLATNIEYGFKNSDNGIKKFNFLGKGGQLIGIMGGSGVGKSTLLNILNGSLKPHSGEVMINGVDIYEKKEKIQGIIGYIPQDDFLLEELTVFQNLYFNARFCHNTLTEEETKKLVARVLKDLDLLDIHNLKVGTPLNKLISGGQRKRLNIALELLREPYVLFVDEPTSGLSSNDSEKVMELLKNQTYKGKLIIVNIHQPSSDIFKMFDSLLVLDKGGRPVYYGNTIDSVVYFKSAIQSVNALESECIWCGNINPEKVLQIVETKEVDVRGKITGNRMIAADEWYQLYISSIDTTLTKSSEPKDFPQTNFKLPGKFKQFLIYSYRNLLTKFADKQYLSINLLEAPLLALILGYFTKYAAGNDIDKNAYVFSENLNLPAFLLMSVIVALFLGMIVNAEEIIRDAKLLKRESFLNLSKVSYFNSKIVYLISISAFQMLVYVLVGNFVLEIRGMTFIYWTILFSISVFAGLLSLNISATLRSVVAIYILIPLLLIPQILLCGLFVKFDKLNSVLKSETVVPLIGDLMASRWAYEALSVAQFRDNFYEKNIYYIERDESNATYCTNFWIPELLNRLGACEILLDSPDKKKKLESELLLLKNELSRLSIFLNLDNFNESDKLTFVAFNSEVAENARSYLRSVRTMASAFLTKTIQNKDAIINGLQKIAGGQGNIQNLKNIYYNNSLADQVLNKNETDKIIEVNNQLYRKYEPIYMQPELKNGRAHFYAPYKQIGNYLIDTVWFNIAILWVMSFVFYILLITNILKRGAIFFIKFFNLSYF